MKVVEFPQANCKIAESQDEYQTIPAWKSKDGRVIALFELDDEDKKRILETGEIWIDVLTFNQQLQPFFIHTETPFEE